jgi:hypothetical protein
VINNMNEEKPFFGQSDIVRLSDEDGAGALLERAVTGLWEVVNELTRFRGTTRQDYRMTTFGSAEISNSRRYDHPAHSPGAACGISFHIRARVCGVKRRHGGRHFKKFILLPRHRHDCDDRRVRRW